MLATSAPATTPARDLWSLPGPWFRGLFTARPAAAGLDPGVVDWAAVAPALSTHALTPLAYRRLDELGLLAALPDGVRRAWAADAAHARLQAALQRRAATAVTTALGVAGVRHAFFKGYAYRVTFYRPGWVRVAGDLDVLVDRPAVEAARAALVRAGFVQASSSLDYQRFAPADPRQVATVEANHYELAQFVRRTRLTDPPSWVLGADFVRRSPYPFELVDGDVLFHDVVDLHWTPHFAFARERPLESVRPAADVPVLGAAWSLFTSSFKLYFEAFDRPHYGLHHLIDLAALVESGLDAAEWRTVADLVSRYGMQAAAFWTLSYADRLARQGGVPPSLLDAWSVTAPAIEDLPPGHLPHRTFHSQLDLGDFLPYLTGRRAARPLFPEA